MSTPIYPAPSLDRDHVRWSYVGSDEDHAWLRSRMFRHRQAHFYNMAFSYEAARSICNKYLVALRNLTKYKEYEDRPSNVCSKCEKKWLSRLLKEIER